ncbi:MAG: hypothetical protein WBC06_05765 [Chitinophagaceae bacterium]
MDRKILTIILGAALVVSFFLPVSSYGGSVSAFDIVKGPSYGSGVEAMVMKYLWLLIPVSGIMLLAGALNNNNYFLGRGLWAILPLLTILYLFIGQPLINGAEIGDIFKVIGKGWGVGIWVALVSSLVLAFYWPKQK